MRSCPIVAGSRVGSNGLNNRSNEMATNLISRMMRNVHPFQIKDPVSGVRVLARFIAPHEEIEDCLAAWEIIPMPARQDDPVQAAA
jgi:hypothetical protein